MTKRKLEICFTPGVFDAIANKESAIVVLDVLRATSSICAAFANGVKEIIPVADLDEAREMQSHGFLIAAERDGYVPDFADFGNSPFNFSPEKVKGKSVVYSTTNGTALIKMVSDCDNVAVGSYINISALCEWVENQEGKAVIVCSGWKGRFSLEDAVCAGAMAEKLLASGKFETICDQVHAATDLWSIAENDLLGYVSKTAQWTRLGEIGLSDCIPYCHTLDITGVVPVLRDKKIVAL